jgi:hypothetical protein
MLGTFSTLTDGIDQNLPSWANQNIFQHLWKFALNNREGNLYGADESQNKIFKISIHGMVKGEKREESES